MAVVQRSGLRPTSQNALAIKSDGLRLGILADTYRDVSRMQRAQCQRDLIEGHANVAIGGDLARSLFCQVDPK